MWLERGFVLTSVASLVGIGLMAVVATTSDAPTVEVSSLERHVGSTVRVQGVVLDVRTHDSGWTRFLLADGNRSVAVTVDERPFVSSGDVAGVTGIVERLGGRLQVRGETAADIVVVRPWRERHVDLRYVLEHPWEHEGSNLATSGLLEGTRLHPVLRALASEQRVRAYGDALGQHELGMFLSVEGVLEYDPSSAAFRLHVVQAEHVQPPSG